MSIAETELLIATLWRAFRPLVDARVQLIESYLDQRGAPGAPASTPLEAETLAQAQAAAHNLAGALGSYGRPEGSTLAAQIERALGQADLDTAAARSILRELRDVVTR